MPFSLRYLDRSAATGVVPVGTLVLLHAFPLNARMWEPQLTLAERGWRVVAPQFPGIDGGHEPPISSFENVAGEVEALLDGLGIERAVIGGLSMGGYVAFALFRRAPARFGGMVLADTRADADSPEARQARVATLETLRKGGVSAVLGAVLPRLVSRETVERRPEVVARVRELALASSAEATAGAVTALMARADSTPLLAQIRCPTLVVVGERDAITPPTISQGISQAIAGSRLVQIGGAGHLSNLERPDAFNAALGDFLAHLATS